MDNEFKDIEDALKELTPRRPSDGARWNLDQRLSDLDNLEDAAHAIFPQHRLLLIVSAAASIFFLILVWTVLSRDVSRSDGTGIVKTPPLIESLEAAPTLVDTPNVTVDGGMEFVRDETDYPATIPFEMKRHVTAVHDLGIVQLPDQPPMRRVRREFVRELRVRDPETGKRYRVQKPDFETILIPLNEY